MTNLLALRTARESEAAHEHVAVVVLGSRALVFCTHTSATRDVGAFLLLGTGRIDVNPSGSGGRETSRSNTASVAAAVLDLPETAGRTIEFRDGTLPIAAALEPQA